jgi:hypothetical protein
MALFNDAVMTEILDFLDACQKHGRKVQARFDLWTAERSDENASAWDNFSSPKAKNEVYQNTVAYEARRLKHAFLQLFDF